MERRTPAATGVEVWGGVEPTVRRVGDGYFDQLERGRHASRPDDLDLIAGLGLRRLRYPVLWERVAPVSLDNPDWRWIDERLGRLRELGQDLVLGLLHHGSGPRYTDLLDPAFPEKFARYARLVAERYPWADLYTPINEPLTTARFSALYGLWYPHRRDHRSFVRALANQCRATVLAMREIRAVNAQARLLQTEDLGKMYSTALLRYQARHENERRWLTFDLLRGELGPERPLWSYLVENGLGEAELEWFRKNRRPPDVLGINTYITSERLIVEDVDAYPERFRGGNAEHRYADLEAVRASTAGIAGHLGLLREAWDRYRAPLALTEVQLAGTREEQLRWLAEAWSSARQLRAEGVELRAVGAWALFGSHEWDSLLTEMRGHYEPGAFDIRSPRPRRTAVARQLACLAAGGEFSHPVLATPGWWRRPERILFRPVTPVFDGPPAGWTARALAPGPQARPLLVTGATGTLGAAFAKLCAARGLLCRLSTRQDADLAEPAAIAALLERVRPWAVVNAAGYVRVDEAESDRERCFRENAEGAALLARECALRRLPFLTFSSDLVFGGDQEEAYLESARPQPLSAYGESKAAAERLVLEACPGALVVRSAAFFGPWDRHNFVFQALAVLARGGECRAAQDQTVSPTYVPDLVHACLDLLLDGESGIWHLANEGCLNWAQLARAAAARAGLDPAGVRPVAGSELGLAAARPRQSVLASERGALMPRLDDALDRYFLELDPALRAGFESVPTAASGSSRQLGRS